MASRAVWKGWLRVDEISCAVALHVVASTSDRAVFHAISRKSGHRLRRRLVDAESGVAVARDDQVKGFEVEPGRFVVLEPDEIRDLVPEGDKTLDVECFLPCRSIDTLYLERPYHLVPADPAAVSTFGLLRAGLLARDAAALARAVLFRRVRRLLVRPHGEGMIADLLNFDYEVRDADEALSGVPPVKVTAEMLDLARHIIDSRAGSFDPASVDDRYKGRVAEMVRAKIAGKPLPRRRAEPPRVVSLLDALRESAASAGQKAVTGPRDAAPRRSAGGRRR